MDWSQSKVIFISPSFTSYQKQAINFKDLPIELWEIKKYTNNNVHFNQIQTAGAQESVKTINLQNSNIEKVTKEIKVYTEEEHLQLASDEIRELYEKVRDAILNLDNLELKPKKRYIAFVSNSNVVDINIQKTSLKLWINLKKGELNDLRGVSRDVSFIGHWGNGDYEIQMRNDEDLEYILSLIRQSQKRNGK